MNKYKNNLFFSLYVFLYVYFREMPSSTKLIKRRMQSHFKLFVMIAYVLQIVLLAMLAQLVT